MAGCAADAGRTRVTSANGMRTIYVDQIDTAVVDTPEMRRTGEVFYLYDQNRDGRLSPGEFAQFEADTTR